MFAMKRVIISAAFLLLISGYAAAQSTSAKQATTPQKKVQAKKGAAIKNDPKKTVLKQEASADAKSDSSVKLVLPIPKFPVDSSSVPVVKRDQEEL
jgi:hypothetical protein